ncbi:hypothetical protein Ddye_031937 [Dipteronia dyeriana]|uniref:Homeobox domain-containing protein n=1 Tax=Dipteronia dyeriana TaxID=168575 RepID=A0AAD9TJ99_9ROSI|nr:hypothetical protein Ddye_031937 [Dipteronia dyeriana]
MELGLSLGDASKTFGTFMEKSNDHHHHHVTSKSLGFCMGLSIGPNVNNTKETDQQDEDHDDDDDEKSKKHKSPEAEAPIVQLDLLPNTPVQRNPSSSAQPLTFPWVQMGGGGGGGGGGGFDVNKFPLVVDHQAETDQDGASSSPNNSAASSFQTDFCIYNNNNNKRDFDSSGSGALGNHDLEGERASSRNSDDDENGCTRKKLRLSKDQSAFLEESFKEHNTLNPKQKLALAKQLNLRPRQVEVWFQNRRARTKLKQTEVDCEYLKRCCETLTEENRRLHKELQELRALKSSNPFYMQLPATTLTMCPSCERVATTTTTATTTNPPATTTSAATDQTSNKGSGRPRFYPFSHTQNRGHQSTSTSEK